MFLIKSRNILANDATHRRSYINVIKTKIGSIMPRPAEGFARFARISDPFR